MLPRNGDSVKVGPKRLCRLPCGKPLAFRRNPPPFIPSFGWKAEPSSREKGVSHGTGPRKGEAFPWSFYILPGIFRPYATCPPHHGLSMSHIFCWTPGVRALLMPKRAPMGRISSTAVQISTGLWVAKLQRMGLAGPKWRSRKQVWRWEGCCRRLSPLPWGEGGESSEPGEGLLWCLHRIAIERGGDPSPVPRPDEVHRDRGTPSPQGRGPYIRFGHEGNLDKLGSAEPRPTAQKR